MHKAEVSEATYIGPEPEHVTVRAFDHVWRDYPAALAEDLITLEKEGAVYSHFAVEGTEREDETWDFAYYRIQLTPIEIYQYVEASREFERFQAALAGGSSFDEALEAIQNDDVRDRVVNYDGGVTRDGLRIDIRGCLASFYPPGMERLLCGGRRDRYEALTAGGSLRDRIALAMQILNNFPIVARSLRDRQRRRPAFAIENEYDVQDLLFACFRSAFDSAKREEWTPKSAGSAKRMDLVIPDDEIVVEAKYVRDTKHATRIADELRIDFECYHSHPACKQLLVLVHDPLSHISDGVQFGNDLSGLRQKDGHVFDVMVLVR